MRDPNGALNNGHFTSGPLYNGAVVLWEGASLPSLPTTLDALLSSPDGNKVNDLLVFYGGSSYVWLISEPAINFLPFEDPSSDKHALWTTVNLVYEQNAKAISADLTKAYTVYQPQTINDPGWDPTVPDRDYYTVPDRWNSDYPPPSTWTQYIFNVANDRVQVPEPGALLLLGFGLMAVAGMRRVVKAKA
jgi:hypothetical protein